MAFLTVPNVFSASAAPIIQMKDVVKSFGTQRVLSGLNLTVQPGESLVLLGRSGCGKSVLLKCLLGLLKIDGGDMWMEGTSIRDESWAQQEKRLQHIGMVFQSSALFDSLCVWENITFRLLNIQEKSTDEMRQIAVQMLQAVGLEPNIVDLYPSSLSGGMQRRVALARAIVSNPSILFFDEPTAGLDPVFCAHISTLIRDSISNLKATAVTITHDLKAALTIADRLAMLHDGVIVWQGPPQALMETDHPVVRLFVDPTSQSAHG